MPAAAGKEAVVAGYAANVAKLALLSTAGTEVVVMRVDTFLVV